MKINLLEHLEGQPTDGCTAGITTSPAQCCCEGQLHLVKDVRAVIKKIVIGLKSSK